MPPARTGAATHKRSSRSASAFQDEALADPAARPGARCPVWTDRQPAGPRATHCRWSLRRGSHISPATACSTGETTSNSRLVLTIDEDVMCGDVLTVRDISATRVAAESSCSAQCDRPPGVASASDFWSLGRARLAAGARGTITALWNIDERRDASALMLDFYRADLSEDGGGVRNAAQALREAQRAARTQRSLSMGGVSLHGWPLELAGGVERMNEITFDLTLWSRRRARRGVGALRDFHAQAQPEHFVGHPVRRRVDQVPEGLLLEAEDLERFAAEAHEFWRSNVEPCCRTAAAASRPAIFGWNSIRWTTSCPCSGALDLTGWPSYGRCGGGNTTASAGSARWCRTSSTSKARPRFAEEESASGHGGTRKLRRRESLGRMAPDGDGC